MPTTITAIPPTKNLKFVFNELFREFQSFGTKSVSDGWNGPTDASTLNYATSEYGNKIFVIDTAKNYMYFVIARETDQGATIISNIKTAVNNATKTTDVYGTLATIVGTNAYIDAVDLSQDAIYKQAFVLNPSINSDAANMGAWVSSMIDGSNSLLASGKITGLYGAVPVFYYDQKVYGFAATGTTNNAGHADISDVILVTSMPEGSRTNLLVDGVSGPTDMFVLSSTLKPLLKTGTGVNVNLSGSEFSVPVGTSSVKVAAQSFTFTTTESASGAVYSGRIVNIDCLSGTDGSDILIGTSAREFFEPGLGADIVIGNGTTYGGSLLTKDRVAYWSDDVASTATKGITVKTETPVENGAKTALIPLLTVTDLGGATDKLYNINYVAGSMLSDLFTNTMTAKTYTGNNLTYSYEAEFCGMGGSDTFIGTGAFFTRVSYAYDAAGVTVNLSASSIKDSNGNTVLSKTAKDGFGGTDILTDINGIRGSDFADYMVGGDKSEVLTTGSDNDYINGGRGNDDIWGGIGDDKIIGGAGVDIMFGDSFLNDSSVSGNLGADTFVFTNIADAAGTNLLKAYNYNVSTQSVDLTKSHRVGDIIMDFKLGQDVIDLSAIDANTRLRSDQKFTLTTSTTIDTTPSKLMLTDASLTLSSTSTNPQYYNWKGDFKTNSVSSGTLTGVLLEGDVNGDKLADFSVFLVGVAKSDFTSDYITSSFIL